MTREKPLLNTQQSDVQNARQRNNTKSLNGKIPSHIQRKKHQNNAGLFVISSKSRKTGNDQFQS